MIILIDLFYFRDSVAPCKFCYLCSAHARAYSFFFKSKINASPGKHFVVLQAHRLLCRSTQKHGTRFKAKDKTITGRNKVTCVGTLDVAFL